MMDGLRPYLIKCGEAATDNSAFRIPNYAFERSDKLRFSHKTLKYLYPTFTRITPKPPVILTSVGPSPKEPLRAIFSLL